MNDQPTTQTALEWVRTLHRPYRIFDECDHVHEYTEDGALPDGVVEVDEIGFTCEDAYLYSICRECCTGGSGYQSEQCVDTHPHERGENRHCNTMDVIDKALEVPS